MPIDQDSWRHHQAAAAELLGRRAEAWPERPPELVAASKEHTGALAQLIVDEAEQAVDPADLSTVTTLLDTDNPIFICGVMKSGTTLLLNLLDAHPAVAALPGDSFLRDAIAQPFSTESIKTHLEHWVRRMMNPSGQHPFFVLGAGPDRYVRFVRVMRAAMDDSSHRIASHRIAPLAAAAGIADALNHGGHQQAGTRRLVEKTPDNEHHFDRLVDAFPGARFLHILREPEQNLRSLMKLHEVRERAHREDWLRDSIAQSHEAAGQNVKALGADRYRIVRYEGITEHAREGMQSIAEWLGVLWSQSLTTPTVLGIPAASNSMWKGRQVVGKVIANQHAGPATSV